MAFTIAHGTTSCPHTLSDNEINKLKKDETIKYFVGRRDCIDVKKQRDSLFRVISNPSSDHGQKISAFLILKAMQVTGSKPHFSLKPVTYSRDDSKTLEIIMENEAGKKHRLYQTVILSGQCIKPIDGTDKAWLKLSNMNLKDLTPEDLQWINCDANHAYWSNVRLDHNTFSHVEGVKFNLSNAVLKFCHIKDCALTGLILTSAEADNLVIENCDLTGADLSRSSFKDAKFIGVDLSGANLSGADFEGATFKSCTFSDQTNWEGAQLERVTTNNPVLQTLVNQANLPLKTIKPSLSGLLACVDPTLLSASQSSLAPSITSRHSLTAVGVFHDNSAKSQYLTAPSAFGMTGSQSHNNLKGLAYFPSAEGMTLASQIIQSTSQLQIN